MRSASSWLSLFLLACAAAALFTLRGYGASYDEPGLFRYARETRQAYRQTLNGLFDQVYADPIQKHYGPFFFVTASLAADLLSPTGLPEPDRWHLFYVAFFILSLIFFYRLARRWLSGWGALAVVILFATQPVIWGHALMNPKDTPVLGFVILTLLTGLNLLDQTRLPAASGQPDREPFPAPARDSLRRQALRAAAGIALLWALLPLGLRLAAAGLKFLLASDQTSWAHFLLSLTGISAQIPAANYIHKLTLWVIFGATLLTAGLLLAWGLKILPRFPTLRARLQELLAWLTSPRLIFSAALLGITLSLRLTTGLLAVALALIFFARLRARALPLTLAYGLWAALAMYLAWPFLWLRPFKNLLQSLRVMAEFSRPGPWDAYPRLLLQQWTEPALLLMAFGLFAFLFVRKHCPSSNSSRTDFSILFFSISLAPLVALMVNGSLLYDNFRQMLFIWPGFFLLAGFAFERIFERLTALTARLAVIGLAASVGAAAIVQLQPYSYAYYNLLTGGVSGAAQAGLPTDYWGISLRAAAHYLNANAPAGAQILVCGPADSLKFDLRPGLSARYGCDETRAAGFDYAVINQPTILSASLFASQPAEFTIQRQGAILTRVIHLRPIP